MNGYNEMHLCQESMREIVQDWINKSYTVYNQGSTRRQVNVSHVKYDVKSAMFVVELHGVVPQKKEQG